MLEDARQLAFETHREHLVGFVEHEHANLGRLERAAPEVVEHAARRADDDLRAGRERSTLPAHRRAAVDGDDVDVARAPICSSSPVTCSASSRVGTG